MQLKLVPLSSLVTRRKTLDANVYWRHYIIITTLRGDLQSSQKKPPLSRHARQTDRH